jgi:hypothetical protein
LRIEVKTVKKLKYLQFIDKDGQRYHLGSVTDANSWLSALIFWNQQLKSEFEQKKIEVLKDLVQKMTTYSKIGDLERKALLAIARNCDINEKPTKLKLRVPKCEPFASYDKNEYNHEWNDYGLELQKRVRTLYWARKKNERKQSKLKRIQKDVREKVHSQNIEAFRFVHDVSKFPSEKVKQILSIIFNKKQSEGRIVERRYVIETMLMKHATELGYTDNLIEQLLIQGVIFEPKKGYLDFS